MKKIYFAFLFAILAYNAFGACPTIPAAPSCPSSTTSPTPIPPGGSLSSNTNYVLSGATQSITSFSGNVSSTNVYICSGETLTVTGSINGNGAKYYVLPGGVLHFTSGTNTQFNAASTMYVYGTVNVTTKMTLNTGADLEIAAGGTFNSPLVTQNGVSTFATEGTANISTFDFANNGATACVNSAGCIKTGSIVSMNTTIQTSSALPGVYYITSATCPTVASSTGVVANSPTNICFAGAGPCSNTSGANVFGTANVTYNCSPTGSSCSAAITLPVSLIYFKTNLTVEGVRCEWEIESNYDSDYFTIEKSEDGIFWKYVTQIAIEHNSEKLRQYSIIDALPGFTKGYYKLSEVDLNGKITPYTISFVEVGEKNEEYRIYPNPTSGDLNISILGELTGATIEIIDLHGNIIKKAHLNTAKTVLTKTFLKSGIYLAKIKRGAYLRNERIVVEVTE